MEALMFFGIAFGFLFVLGAGIAIIAYKKELNKTSKIHSDIFREFYKR